MTWQISAQNLLNFFLGQSSDYSVKNAKLLFQKTHFTFFHDKTELDYFSKGTIILLIVFVKVIHCSVVKYHSHCFQLDVNISDDFKKNIKDIGTDILLRQLLLKRQLNIINEANQVDKNEKFSFTDHFGVCESKSRNHFPEEDLKEMLVSKPQKCPPYKIGKNCQVSTLTNFI